MSKFRYFTIDTNFFISGFGETPNAYIQLNKIFTQLKIKIKIPDYVQKEMRWYMRRSIEPHLEVVKINPAELKKFENQSRGKVSVGLPQTPDMAVAFLAMKENLSIVSSDLRLVEVAQQLGMTAMMNSAFLVMLLEEVKSGEDNKYLQDLYNVLIADEITHSVKSQGKYDPVIRIQKIMDSALSVIKKQTLVEEREELKVKENYDFPEYKQLVREVKRIRTDISDYLDLLENGDLKKVKFELNEGIIVLSDLLVEMQLEEIDHTDDVLKEATTTLGHILLLASAVALMEQRLDDASAIIDQLTILLTHNKQLEERLDVEIHLQRMTIFFLTEQFNRFKLYFTPNFMRLCERRNRSDLLSLFRTMGIVIAVLKNKSAEDAAKARDFSEIQYVIQLGVQFIAMDKVENAWLLLEQALYMSLNSKMTGLLFAVFEVLLPLSFKLGDTISPSFEELLEVARKHNQNLPFEDYDRRSTRIHEVNESHLRKRTVAVNKLPTNITGFLDVISAEVADFKNIGRCIFVRTVDWQTMNFIGIVDPTLSLDSNLTVGCSVKLQSGNMRIIKATTSIQDKRGVDLVVICKPEKLRFIIRRAGQLQVAQSRVGEYDL